MNLTARMMMWALIFGASCGYGYSDGDRTGIVTKLSRKGMAFKSWEGEMNLGGMLEKSGDNGAATMIPNVWEFHVNDEDHKIVDLLQKTMTTGERVRIHYKQYMISPCTQDSDYDVTEVVTAP